MPLLSLVGPTATGKTALSLSLSQRLLETNQFAGVTLISADSRQVYQGLETLTGADIPSNFNPKQITDFSYPFFVSDQLELSLHGVSIIAPDEEWSVAHFRELAQAVIAKSLAQEKLPIVVGGTGFYHRQLLTTDPQIEVPPKPKIRHQAAQLPLRELQTWAKEMQPKRFAGLNNSDKNNPRRLVRIIEIGQAKQAGELDEQAELPAELENTEHLFIGLELKKDQLVERIEARVQQRFATGAPAEVEQVFNRYNQPTQQKKIPAFTTLGFRQLLRYTQGEITRETCLEAWSKKEVSYAKRQLRWFKKNQQVSWFAADMDGLEAAVYSLLEKKL